MERLEGLLNLTFKHLEVLFSKFAQQYKVPANHGSVINRDTSGKPTETINTSCLPWGRGFVVPSMGRELEIELARSYSTKTPSEAPSWKDSKVAKRLESL